MHTHVQTYIHIIITKGIRYTHVHAPIPARAHTSANED